MILPLAALVLWSKHAKRKSQLDTCDVSVVLLKGSSSLNVGSNTSDEKLEAFCSGIQTIVVGQWDDGV